MIILNIKRVNFAVGSVFDVKVYNQSKELIGSIANGAELTLNVEQGDRLEFKCKGYDSSLFLDTPGEMKKSEGLKLLDNQVRDQQFNYSLQLDLRGPVLTDEKTGEVINNEGYTAGCCNIL